MKKSYFRGIIGALLGGLLASIPWILVYVYANMIYSILAVLIAMGAFKGYQLFGGKINKKLPIIIVLVSLISITLSTLVIIPMLLLLKDSVLNIDNIRLLYSNSEFISALMQDYVISILFTFLGISGVIASLRKQIKDGEEIDLSFGNGVKKKEINEIKEFFLSRNAIDERSAVKLDGTENIKTEVIDYLVSERILVEKEGKYYYNVQEDERMAKQKKKNLIITFSTIIVIVVILAVIVFSSMGKVDDGFSTYKISGDYKKVVDNENENSWFYLPKDDQSGNSGYIMFYYLDGEYVYSDEILESIKSNFNQSDDLKQIKSSEHFKSSKSLDVAFFDIELEEYSEHIYYVFGTDNLCVVEVVYYNDNSDLLSDAKDIVNSFKWKK